VFSAAYGGISTAKRHHLGVVGRVLGKELGKDFWCPFSLNCPANHASPCARSGGDDKPLKYPPIFHAAEPAVITKGDRAEAVGFDSASTPRNIQVVSLDLHRITV
jgi:Ni2+-binding GTPase involved in maturation of urease and hydrogenase